MNSIRNIIVGYCVCRYTAWLPYLFCYFSTRADPYVLVNFLTQPADQPDPRIGSSTAVQTLKHVMLLVMSVEKFVADIKYSQAWQQTVPNTSIPKLLSPKPRADSQAIKLFQITPYVNDFRTLNNPGSWQPVGALKISFCLPFLTEIFHSLSCAPCAIIRYTGRVLYKTTKPGMVCPLLLYPAPNRRRH